MKNCLVEKWIAEVNNNDLLKLGEIVIDINKKHGVSVAHGLFSCRGVGTEVIKKTLIGANFVDSSGNDTGSNVSTEPNVYIKAQDGLKLHLENIYNAYTIQNPDYLETYISIDQIKYMSPSTTLIKLRLPYSSGNAHIQVVDFDVEKIHEVFSALTTLELRGGGIGVYGDFSYLGYITTITGIDLQNCNIHGDFVDFVKKAVSKGKSSGTVTFNTFVNTYTGADYELKFDGTVISGSTITSPSLTWSTSGSTVTVTLSATGVADRTATFTV